MSLASRANPGRYLGVDNVHPELRSSENVYRPVVLLERHVPALLASTYFLVSEFLIDSSQVFLEKSSISLMCAVSAGF